MSLEASIISPCHSPLFFNRDKLDLISYPTIKFEIPYKFELIIEGGASPAKWLALAEACKNNSTAGIFRIYGKDNSIRISVDYFIVEFELINGFGKIETKLSAKLCEKAFRTAYQLSY